MLDVVRTHLVAYGIMTSYQRWCYHGEVFCCTINDEDDDVEDDIDDCCRTKMNNDLKLRVVRPKAGPSGRTRAKGVNTKVLS